ncbi:MAG TPA: hypothetical protein VFI42_03950 [Thermomicrobiaceae bacterium]|nr:hypothetical protein [Thermomicrobiaceae bacterium]
MYQVELEVIAPILGSFDHRFRCQLFRDGAGLGRQLERGDFESYPPALQAEFEALAELLLELSGRYGRHLVIRVADPGSLRGRWSSVRFRVRRFPTFIVDDDEQICGLDATGVDRLIRSHLAAPRARD